MEEKFDFGGYATRFNVKCTDGRTITDKAFAHCDGVWVPLAWQHNHSEPDTCIGKGYLEHRDDGVYIYGIFNDTERGKTAKKCVQHGDVNKLSIYANHVQETNGVVMHGDIQEVSLVYAGANKGAYIDTISFAHEDGSSDECIIFSGDLIETDVEFKHSDTKEESKMVDEKKEKTVGEIIDSMTEEQKRVMWYVAEKAAEEAKNGESDDEDESDDVKHYDEGDDDMVYNAFENGSTNDDAIMHADFMAAEEGAIFADAKRCGSFKDSMIAHAATYGIDNLEVLFPDAKMVGTPATIDRDQEWVGEFMSKASKVPFANVKSALFNITGDEARAKGYIKGQKKVSEVIKAIARKTEPATIYKLQAFDRDDILDMDFDAVSYILPEMKSKLNEELARAALISDGRDESNTNKDKIPEDHIRPIWKDDDVYSVRVPMELESSATSEEKANAFIDACIRNRKKYKGSGNPIMYMSEDMLGDLLLLKDAVGHFMYKSITELCTVLRVSNIRTLEQFSELNRKGRGKDTGESESDTYALAAIMVNPKDYTFGSVKGGEITSFNDFDIDYNQYKYLIETRLSGALTVPYSALVFEFLEKAGG